MCYFDLPSLQKNINPLAIFCDYAGKKKPHLAEGERNWVCKCKLKTNKEEKPEPPTFLGEAILKIEARMISECCNTTGDLNFQSWTKATDSSPWFASAVRPAALSASRKRRVNIGADVPATHLKPWNSKINCAIHFFSPNTLDRRSTADKGRGYQGIICLPSPLLDCGSSAMQQVTALAGRKLRGCPATGESQYQKNIYQYFSSSTEDSKLNTFS